jgi:hypothetical protein
LFFFLFFKKKHAGPKSLAVAYYRGPCDIPGLGPCVHLFQAFGHPSIHSFPEKKRKKKKKKDASSRGEEFPYLNWFRGAGG